MAQAIVRNLSERAIAAFKARAAKNGTSLEHELRQLIERHALLGPLERSIAAARLRGEVKGPLPPLAETGDGLTR